MITSIAARVAVALSLAIGLGAAALVLRRRAVYLLGRRTAALAPGVLLTVWLTGLALGERTGSLVAMAFVGVAPLVAAAVAARRWTAPRHQRSRLLPRWTWIDWTVVALIAAVLLVVDLFDVHCHRAVAGAFLRGNIPPAALNDPRFSLPYHSLFDGVVALVMMALPADTELALDLVAIGCVALTMNQVAVLARIVFCTRAAAQAGRVLFFLGFGPTVLRYLWSGPSMRLLHGESTQAYLDIILRRPTVLGLTVFTLCLAMLAPLYAGAARPTRPARAGVGGHPLWLAPAVFVMPLLAEEMVLHLGAFAALLFFTRRTAIGWAFAGISVFALGALASGVFGPALGAPTSMAAPHLALSWPPALPSWTDSEHGVALVSRDGVLVLLTELGPLLAATYVVVMVRGPMLTRALLLPLLAGLTAAVFLRLDGWNKADMDRFLFTGTPIAFMLLALWVDVCQQAAARRFGATPRARRLATVVAATLVLVTAAPPAVYAAYTAVTNPRNWYRFWRDRPGQELRETLAVVGAREPILTNGDQADALVQAGFIVLGPMTSTSIGDVDEGKMDQYLKANADRADWLFLPEGDARLAGRPVVAARERYRLVRARPAPGVSAETRR